MKLITISRPEPDQTRTVVVSVNGREWEACAKVNADGSYLLIWAHPGHYEAVEAVLASVGSSLIRLAMERWEYGCCKCQAYHVDGDPLFEDHKFFQSKHGMRRRVV